MKLTKTTWFRAGKWIGMFLIGLAWAWVACAQTISTTTVQGTVYLANGAPGSGTLQLSWPAFTTASGAAVAAGRTSATIGTDGFVSVNLVPNLGSSPAGLFYTAVYNMSDGTTSTEYWVVPAAAQATIAQVRAQVMPAAQAVQAVTKSYVDQAIQTMASSSLSPSGGTLTGPLYLSGDPSQPLQAADKHYVDSSFALAMPLSGGTLTGPGYAASDPPGGAAARLQFATQHYADTSQRYNVKDAGAVGDGRAGTMTTSTVGGITTVTCNACSFTAADAGKTINIPGAGATYLQGGALGTATVTINTSGVVTAVSFSGYSGLPASATIPVTFSSAGSSPAVTAKGYITTNSSGAPTMHIWVGGMDYAAAPTISVGWAQDGSNVLPGAGLKTTIASVVDSTHVTLATAATTDVTTGVKAYYGTDDTAALNSAMQTVLSQPINWTDGGQQFFVPCGTYLISGALTVNNSSAVPTGFRILGSAMGCVKLVQLTDNTPILNLTQGGAWGFQVSDLSFDYANYQPPSFTNSVGVYFNASGNGNDFYTWDMSRLMFYGGFRGIGIGNANQAVWGYTIDRVTGGGGLSGATLYLSNAGGDPRIQLRHIYSTQTVGEPVISTGVAGSVTASSIEADNAYGTVFSLLGNHLQLNDAECELCYRTATGQYFVIAYASDVNVRGSDDHAIPPNIGSPISVIEYQTTSAPTLVAGSVDIQQSVVKVDPCYGISSGCTPPSHYAYIGQDNQLTAQTFKGNFVYAAPPEVLSRSAMLSTNSNALLYGSVTQQNLATSDGYFQVQNAASPYQFDATQSVYQSLNIPANLSSGNFSFLNGWQGAKMRVRLVQPPQGSGPYTVSAPGNVLGFLAPPSTNGYGGTGTGATCTATIGSGTVTGVTCSGGTGYPANTQIRLQFIGGTSTASNVPVVPPAAFITTDGSGNLTGSATMSTNGANYATAPTVGVGMAYSEQTYVFDQELSKWIPSGPATVFDGVNLTTQQAVTATVPGIKDTGILSAPALSTDGSGNVTTASTTGTGSVVLAASPALTGTPTAPTAAQGTNTTQVATTAFVQTQTATTAPVQSYILSRSGNLVTNGTAYLKNNQNFPSLTYDGAQGVTGGSFYSSTAQSAYFTNELMPVDTGLQYKMSLWATCLATCQSGNQLYAGITAFDIDQNQIFPEDYVYVSGTTTTLAAQLNPGDTTITLTSSANWAGSSSNSYQRQAIFWNYINAGGYAYPVGTYSKNNTTDGYGGSYVTNGLWAVGGISGNVITLTAAWSGPTIPAGTSLSNTNPAGTYQYVAAGAAALTSSWQQFSGYISGTSVGGTQSNSAFAPGTAFIRGVFLLNYGVTGQTTHIANIEFAPSMIAAGTTGSIGGSALTAGQEATGTASIPTATTSMTCDASAAAGCTAGAGFVQKCRISAAGSAAVSVVAVVAGTPAACTYNVRAIQ
ncbi:MAG: hypothetical protein KGM96_09190 [Acidobacteriota bacterium]|nr:hypothetical protein [Acidobacteriota bacterium]